MKIIMIECDAKELRANRTVLDSISEAVSSFTRTLVGVDITSEMVARAFTEGEEENDEESEG